MDVTFDGTNKLCILGAGTVEFLATDLYSRWKDWKLQGDNAKYLQAFRSIGGDPLVGNQKISGYIFLMNGWRVRPQEADHMLSIVGNLFTDEGASPFVPTLGVYNVMIQMVTSANVIQLATGSGLSTEEHDHLMTLPDVTLETDERQQLMSLPLAAGLSVSEHDQLMAIPLETLTSSEHDQLMAIQTELQNLIIEGQITFQQAMRYVLATLTGKSTQVGNLVKFRDTADSKDRITAVVDANGQRLNVTRDAS